MKKQMNLIGAGGTGLNIVSHFLKDGDFTIEESRCIINPCFIDTSRANLKCCGLDESDDRVYIVDGVKEGSGKKRTTNVDPVVKHSKEILHQFKPTDINVVIHSASGGSGSVIGPILVSEMVKNNYPVICIAVGGSDSRIEIDNTIKTIEGYEVTSRRLNKPINMVYYENGEVHTIKQVNEMCSATIGILSVLFSGEVDHLDSADLDNFLNYQNVSENDPQLTSIDFLQNVAKTPKGQSIIAAVTLTDHNTPWSFSNPIDYHSVGYINDSIKRIVRADLPINMVSVVGYFTPIIERLKVRLTEIDDMRNAVICKRLEVSDAAADEHGLIL